MWERWYHPVARVRWANADWHTARWAVFGAGYVGVVAFVAFGLNASAGELGVGVGGGTELRPVAEAHSGVRLHAQRPLRKAGRVGDVLDDLRTRVGDVEECRKAVAYLRAV